VAAMLPRTKGLPVDEDVHVYEKRIRKKAAIGVPTEDDYAEGLRLQRLVFKKHRFVRQGIFSLVAMVGFLILTFVLML